MFSVVSGVVLFFLLIWVEGSFWSVSSGVSEWFCSQGFASSLSTISFNLTISLSLSLSLSLSECWEVKGCVFESVLLSCAVSLFYYFFLVCVFFFLIV